MNPTILCWALYLCLSCPVALGQLAIIDYVRDLITTNLDHQTPIMNIPNIFLPGSKDDDNKDSKSGGDVIISDVIGKDRIISIFAGFTRNIDTVAKRLDDGSQNTTVLAPTNGELQKLPRKPWEDPEDYEALGQEAYTGASGEDRAQRNLRRFVEAHTIPTSPWKSGEKVQSMGGGQVWWEEIDGKKLVHLDQSIFYVNQPLTKRRSNLEILKFQVLRIVCRMGRFG